MVDEEKNLWWRKLGFYTNPFTIKPAVFDNKVFGQDKILEELYYKILSEKNVHRGNYVTVQGSVLAHSYNERVIEKSKDDSKTYWKSFVLIEISHENYKKSIEKTLERKEKFDSRFSK